MPIQPSSAARPVLIGLLVAALLQLSSGCNDASAPSTPGPTPSNMGDLEPGVNRMGRDLSETGSRTTDAAGCARLCAADERCKAMSFMARPAPADGICWLKTSVPEPTPNPAMVSAVKIVPQ